jgi:hypothetical protein
LEAADKWRSPVLETAASVAAAGLAQLAPARSGVAVQPLRNESLVRALVVLEPDTTLVAAIRLGGCAKILRIGA